MNLVLEMLSLWRERQIALLKSGDKKALSKKLQIDRAVQCLSWCEEFQVVPETIETSYVLPVQEAGLFEYRIMCDCEVDQRDQWVELEENGDPIRATPGDVIISKKA